MGYQRTGWEQSAALITADPARAPARSAGVGQQIDWECFRATKLTSGGHKRPSPPCTFHPKLDRCLPGEFPAVPEQEHRLIRQQLPNRYLQLLTPAVPAAGSASCRTHRSRQLRRPAPLAVQVFCPAAAALGEVLATGDQPLVQMAGEQRDAVGAGVVPEEMAGHAGLAAAAGAEHVLIEPGPVFDRIKARGL